MALETLIAGRYSGTFDAVDVGLTENGYELQQESRAEVVNRTDAYGDAAIDTVFRGGDVHLQFESKAYKPGALTPFWPWGGFGVLSQAANPIGRLGSDQAKAMVLTSTPNTPAAATPATLTMPLAILAENFPARLLFDSRVRNVPVRLRALPKDDMGVINWFTTT